MKKLSRILIILPLILVIILASARVEWSNIGIVNHCQNSNNNCFTVIDIFVHPLWIQGYKCQLEIASDNSGWICWNEYPNFGGYSGF